MTAGRRIEPAELVAGLRRFAVVLAVVLAGTAALSLLIGAGAGTGLRRAVSLGMYAVGSLLVLGALFVSGRPPVRAEHARGDRSWLAGPGGRARFMTADERRDLFSVSWLLLALGVIVLVTGLLVDGRHRLV